MPRMIFINLPVTELASATRFYAGLGFSQNFQFSSDDTACMVWSDTIHVMLLVHERWKTFTSRPIPPRNHSEVMLCLSCDSRDEVNALAEGATAHGGTADVNPAQDHGFMMSRSLADPDGHVWEVVWMDPAAMSAPEPAETAA
jgi:predicted lactoylglutathione lyase